MMALAVVGGVFTLMSVLDDGQRRSSARRALARLTVSPEEVTAEDWADRRRVWPRTAILDVVQNSRHTGSEPGNGQVYYSVCLTLADGSSAFLWGSATDEDFPLFRVTEYDESNIRDAVTWLTSTVRQALVPSGKPDKRHSRSD